MSHQQPVVAVLYHVAPYGATKGELLYGITITITLSYDVVVVAFPPTDPIVKKNIARISQENKTFFSDFSSIRWPEVAVDPICL